MLRGFFIFYFSNFPLHFFLTQLSRPSGPKPYSVNSVFPSLYLIPQRRQPVPLHHQPARPLATGGLQSASVPPAARHRASPERSPPSVRVCPAKIRPNLPRHHSSCPLHRPCQESRAPYPPCPEHTPPADRPVRSGPVQSHHPPEP